MKGPQGSSKKGQGWVFWVLVLIPLGISGHAPSRADTSPPCLDERRQPLAIDNSSPLQWKTSTRDGFKARSYVQGVITDVYPGRNSHAHFAIDLDGRSGGDLEVIYNRSFGALPQLVPGMDVDACGDYITAGPRSSLPSPNGAIVHWVHYNPGDRDGGRHPHGFLVIQGQLYGFSPQTSGSSD